MIKYISLLYLVATVSSTSHLRRSRRAVKGNYDYAAADAAVDEAANDIFVDAMDEIVEDKYFETENMMKLVNEEESKEEKEFQFYLLDSSEDQDEPPTDEEKESQLSQFIVLDSDEDEFEPPKHDSAGFIIVPKPLVSKEDYDDLDREMTEEDFEKLDKEIAEEDERESRFNFLDEDGERSDYEEFNEENEVMMSRSQNGGLNFDEFDEESEEDDEYDTMEKEENYISRMRGERSKELDATENYEYDTIDEEDASGIVYPDDMYGNIDNENFDANYADATDAEYDGEDEENWSPGRWRSHDTTENNQYGNQIHNNNEDYEESDEEESQFYLLDEEIKPKVNTPFMGDLDKEIYKEEDAEDEEKSLFTLLDEEDAKNPFMDDEEDASEIVYPDDMYGNIDNENLDADYADATDTEYDGEDEENFDDLDDLDKEIAEKDYERDYNPQ